MNKEQLIQLHIFLFTLKNHFETKLENNGSNCFLSYKNLDVTPFHINKSKRKHQLAIFQLCKNISDMLKENNFSDFDDLSKRMENMCNNIMTNREIEYIRLK